MSGHTFRFRWTVQDLEVFLVLSNLPLAVKGLGLLLLLLLLLLMMMMMMMTMMMLLLLLLLYVISLLACFKS